MLDDVGHAVALGAPAIVHRRRDDAVIADDKVVSVRAGLRLVLEREGIGRAAWVDAADGLQPIASSHDAALREAKVTPGLDGWPLAARALLNSTDRATAVVLADAGLLLDVDSAPGVVGHVVAGACGAARAAEDVPRNALIVLATGAPDVPSQLRGLPGALEIEAGDPGEAERLAALRAIAFGFHGAREVEPADLAAQLRAVAAATPGLSLTALEQLRQQSVRSHIGLDRPRAMIRAIRPMAVSDWASRRTRSAASIQAELERDVVGQSLAMSGVARALAQARRGSPTRAPSVRAGRPRGCITLTGPSGVGKTETARAIARMLAGSEANMIRVDCAKLKGSHDAATLIGAPPGYVGHGNPVALLARIAAQPASVVLFDEIDKCHPDVLDTFLAILEEGELADGAGRPVSFSEAFIVLTTNLGASDVVRVMREGASPAEVAAASRGVAEDLLTADPAEGGRGKPALWSRIQGHVYGFDVLRRVALPAIVAKLADRVEQNLADDDLLVSVDVAAFTARLDAELPPDGDWEGRTVEARFNDLLAAPLAELEVRDPTDGVACLAPQGARA